MGGGLVVGSDFESHVSPDLSLVPSKVDILDGRLVLLLAFDGGGSDEKTRTCIQSLGGDGQVQRQAT